MVNLFLGHPVDKYSKYVLGRTFQLFISMPCHEKIVLCKRSIIFARKQQVTYDLSNKLKDKLIFCWVSGGFVESQRDKTMKKQ